VHWQIPIWVRRLLTMLPALIVIGIGLEPTRTLVLSQVVLSFGLPFALVLWRSSRRAADLNGRSGQPPRHHGYLSAGDPLDYRLEPLPSLSDTLGGGRPVVQHVLVPLDGSALAEAALPAAVATAAAFGAR